MPDAARRRSPARALLLALAAPLLLGPGAEGEGTGSAPGPERAEAEPGSAARVVTLYPSLTATVLALGAEAQLVGVDDYSAQMEPRVRDLPRVGGLFNPSLEAIVGLEPSFVALVPSAQQRGLRERLEALGIDVLVLPNITLEQVLGSIEQLGARLGREPAARRRIAAIRDTWRETREAAAGREPPRAVIVLQRDPLYVVGSGSFLDAMLSAAGARNLAAGFDEPYPRVSVEWLIEAAPGLILDAADPPGGAAEHWARWPSIPAVERGRVLAIADQRITFPGPHLDRAVRRLAESVHGDAPARSPGAEPPSGARR